MNDNASTVVTFPEEQGEEKDGEDTSILAERSDSSQ